MDSLVIDIFFFGLALIPLILNFSSLAVDVLIKSYCKTISKNKNYIVVVPIAIYLIYEMSLKTNLAAQIGLITGLVLFFYIYSCGIAFLVNQACKISYKES